MDAGATAQQRRMPGEPGIWMFIFGDMLVFSLFFGVYAWYRQEQIAVFAEGQAHLSQWLGALNTFFMLSSSWFVASAVQMARRNRAGACTAGFALGVACAVGFGIVKYFEWGAKIHAGIGLSTSDFFMYYFVFTGIHFMHVIIGGGVLTYMALYARSGNFTPAKIRNLESGASFWHVVDLLWIVLFPLVYVMR